MGAKPLARLLLRPSGEPQGVRRGGGVRGVDGRQRGRGVGVSFKLRKQGRFIQSAAAAAPRFHLANLAAPPPLTFPLQRPFSLFPLCFPPVRIVWGCAWGLWPGDGDGDGSVPRGHVGLRAGHLAEQGAGEDGEAREVRRFDLGSLTHIRAPAAAAAPCSAPRGFAPVKGAAGLRCAPSKASR